MKDAASTTPYLIRAIYEWCCDNGHTPYIAVKVDENTRVPVEYVKNGEIVLNIGMDATRNLKIGNDLIQFSARFAGVSREISVPVNAVAGIFAKETGNGLAFQTSPSLPLPVGAPVKTELGLPEDPKPTSPTTGGRPKLQVIK
ncbi:MAG TPA: ClpXP protease specificity-enhancing factor [Burkholderiales bacterium]|nr:ClpXP protease specificity-enhancing factor [Burkholderiales bacterium]